MRPDDLVRLSILHQGSRILIRCDAPPLYEFQWSCDATARPLIPVEALGHMGSKDQNQDN